MIAVARRRLAAYPAVQFINLAFEDWPVEPEAFDLAISAQAFHWIAREAHPRLAQALKPGGCLVPFWNMGADLQGDLQQEIQSFYSQQASEISTKEDSLEVRVRRTVEEIQESGCFVVVDVLRFPWIRRFTTAEYIG